MRTMTTPRRPLGGALTRTTLALVAALAAAACSGPVAGTDAAPDTARPDAQAPMDATPQDVIEPLDRPQPPDAPPADAPPVDAPPVDAPPGEPITAPRETWTWVPIEGAACANGMPTGIAVNLTDRSRRVLIFLQGGGACWDALTCYVLNTAANVRDGYGEAQFRAEQTALASAAFFRRDGATNPFRDASFVYVPYCTGDVHGGDRVAMYDVGGRPTPTHHVGFRNVAAALRRLVPTFAGADRVWLTGASAGGFGTLFNWGQVQEAFGAGTRVDVVDDSGPPISPSAMRTTEWRTAWNLQIPAGCAACATDFGALPLHWAARYPSSRYALLSYEQDMVIATYYSTTGAAIQMGLHAWATRADPVANVRYFFAPGTMHVLLTNPNVTVRTVTLSNWLTQFATDASGWASVRP